MFDCVSFPLPYFVHSLPFPLTFHSLLLLLLSPQTSLTSMGHHYFCPSPLPPIFLIFLLHFALIHLLNVSSPFLPPPLLPSPPFCSWRSSWRGGAANAVLFLRTVLLVQNTDGYYGAAHKLIMLEINCCCQRQPPTCPSVSLRPLMHRIQLMDQMFAQCVAPFKVSTKVVWGLSDLRLFVLPACALLPLDILRK